jgi:mRNA-degrading endonuclease toxin of MazEF toxin-antitoxin module
MAKDVARGEIWLVDRPKPGKRRPVLVLTRPALIPLLETVLVVAVTSTRRGAPSEVDLGTEEGLKQASCANLTNVFTVRRSELRQYVGSVGLAKMHAVCDALALVAGCA